MNAPSNEVSFASTLRSAVIKAADDTFRQLGFCPVPQIHVLAEDMAQPYLGYIHTRPFHQGEDAAKAITELGLFPAAMGATRVLMAWENRDINVAMRTGGEKAPSAVVLAEASMDGHVVHWHPFEVGEIGSVSEHGTRAFVPYWGQATVHAGAALPDPLARALWIWREAPPFGADEMRDMVRGLQERGHIISWVSAGGE
jgi:hypothetical protein